FKRVTPPAATPANQVLNVFALDWYRPSSLSFDALQALAKHGEDTPIDTFRPRLQDLIHRRFLLDTWDYDYITVYPGHEAQSHSSQLVELAQDAVLKTEIIYTPLLERTETVERQREKSEEERRQVAFHPSESLRTRAKLHDDTVILLDDICTTGSSLLAGAHLLRKAGADRVVCIALGLTPGGPQTDVKEITDPEASASEIIAGVDQ
uniref:ComF family protein n=1 Tax=Halalkalirubrum salinum TaxID=2563889 RepID=UPI0010FB5976